MENHSKEEWGGGGDGEFEVFCNMAPGAPKTEPHAGSIYRVSLVATISRPFNRVLASSRTFFLVGLRADLRKTL